jgi:mercuric ion binding protein
MIMKKIIILLIALAPLVSFAQKKNIQKTRFEVAGVCGMCKSRIEKKAFSIKGVKSATWDIPSHQFSVIYDASKVSLEKIHEGIADSGHDTKLATAKDETYNNLPMCCLYDRIVKE